MWLKTAFTFPKLYFNIAMKKKCGKKKCGKHDKEVNNPTLKPKQKAQAGHGGKGL